MNLQLRSSFSLLAPSPIELETGTWRTFFLSSPLPGIGLEMATAVFGFEPKRPCLVAICSDKLSVPESAKAGLHGGHG